jgi:predicted glycosyltransferase
MQPRRVWIDFENAPHVWVLAPVVEILRARGFDFVFTARDFSSTVGLARKLGFDPEVVGRAGAAKGKAGKVLALTDRARRLYSLLRGRRKELSVALSHGARSQAIAGHYLGLRTISLDDYEFSNQSHLRFVDSLLVPSVVPKEAWPIPPERVVHYPGLKEEIYLSRRVGAGRPIPELEAAPGLKVLFRPEAPTAHYRSDTSELIGAAVLRRLAGHGGVHVTLLPREPEQGRALQEQCRRLGVPVWVPDRVLDGPALVSAVDLMVGGGGTMTREAAVLGVPSYSFFAGTWGAVDHHLAERGHLVRLETPDDVEKIALVPRERGSFRLCDEGAGFIADFVAEAPERVAR